MSDVSGYRFQIFKKTIIKTIIKSEFDLKFKSLDKIKYHRTNTKFVFKYSLKYFLQIILILFLKNIILILLFCVKNINLIYLKIVLNL